MFDSLDSAIFMLFFPFYYITPVFCVTCIGHIFGHLSACYITAERPFNCETSNISDCEWKKRQMIITDLTWLKKIMNIACFQIEGII